MTMESTAYFMTGEVPRRGETALTGAFPLAQVLKCSDGRYFTVACFEHQFWVNLCKAIGREDLAPYDSPDDPAQREWAIAEMQKVFITKTRDEWWEFLRTQNTCVAPVLDYDEACDNEQVRARDMVMEFDHPSSADIRQMGIVAKMSDTPGSVRTSRHTRRGVYGRSPLMARLRERTISPVSAVMLRLREPPFVLL